MGVVPVIHRGVNAIALSEMTFHALMILCKHFIAMASFTVEVRNGCDMFQRTTPVDLMGQRNRTSKPTPLEQQGQEDHTHNEQDRMPSRGTLQPLGRPDNAAGLKPVVPLIEPHGSLLGGEG